MAGIKVGRQQLLQRIAGQHRQNGNQGGDHLLEVIAVMLEGRDQAIQIDRLRLVDRHFLIKRHVSLQGPILVTAQVGRHSRLPVTHIVGEVDLEGLEQQAFWPSLDIATQLDQVGSIAGRYHSVGDVIQYLPAEGRKGIGARF